MLQRIVRVLADPQLPQVLQAYILLIVMDMAVRWIGLLPVWRRVRIRCRKRRRQHFLDETELAGLVRAVRGAARHHLYVMPCLPQSLALAWLLAQRGIPVDLRLGVSRKAASIDAHAWLEVAGTPINDSLASTARYVPLDRRKRISDFQDSSGATTCEF